MSVWVPVLPSLKGFAKAVEGEARSAAKRGGAATADEFGKAGAAAGKSLADGLAKQAKAVESASAKLGSARDAEVTASGNVRKAELELERVRSRSGASASQIARAEEALSSAKATADQASSKLARAESDLAAARDGSEGSNRALASAEDRLAASKNAVSKAAGDVRVAELQVSEARDKAAARSAAVSEAEDRLAAALDKSGRGSKEAVSAEKALETARKQAETATKGVADAETRLAKQKAGLDTANDKVAASTLHVKAVNEDLKRSAADVTDELRDQADATEDLDGHLGSAGSSLGDFAAKAGIAAAGIGTIGEAFSTGLDVDNAVGTMNNQLGLTGGAADAAASEVRSVLRSGVVGGADEAAEAIGALNSQFGYLGAEGEQTAGELADNFAAFSQTFGVDMNEAVMMAGNLVTNGLAPDVETAADMMTAAMQRVPAAMRDELPEIMGEYGTNFRALGFEGDEAFGLLVAAADKGKWALDKTGDALKEFSIRGSDMSQASQDAYAAIGLSAEDMSAKIATGGAGAQDALQQVANGILGIEDPAERANTAIALFGTPLEDLSVDQIPDFLGALADGTGGMEDFTGSSQALADNIEGSLQGRLNSVKGTAIDLASAGFMALWDAGQTLADWARKSSGWLVPLGVGLTALAGGMAAYSLAQKAASAGGFISMLKSLTVVTKAQAAAQFLLNGAMWASPITWIAAAIIGLVAGLALFFTKTETGKKVWQGFMDVLKGVWSWIKDVFGAVFSWLGDVISDVWTRIKDGWDVLWQGIQTAWNSVLKPTFDVLWQVVSTTLGVIGTLILAPLLLAWQALSAGISWAWENLIKPAWDALSAAATWLWNVVLMPVFGWIKTGWDMLSQGILWAWQNVIQPAWNAVSTAAQWLWNSVLSPVFGWIRSGWDMLSAGISAVWNNIIRPVWDAFGSVISWVVDNVVEPAFEAVKTALGKVGDFFGTVVDGIKSVWNGLKSILAKPINFMIGTVYNNGIRKAWNMIARFLPIDEASEVAEIPEHATGGAIRGPGTGTSDDVLMWGSNGEHMLTAAEVDALGGQGNVYTLRHMIDQGKAFSYDGKGGVIALPNLPGNVVGDLAGAAPGLFPAFARGGEVTRPAWEAQLERGHRFAQSIAPGPYILGGSSSQGSTDCSGYMSEIADVILGGPGGTRQWATMSFPGPQAGAWEPGLGKGFSVGIVNGGPAGGHTAGTLSAAGPFSAVNVESGGGTGQGATYGGAAVGADHPQFPDHYHLKIGADGAFESAGGPSPEQKRSTLRDKVKNIFDDIMGPVDSALDAAVGTPPPEFFGVPRKSMKGSRDAAVDFLFDMVGKLGDLLGSVYDKAKDVGGAVLDAGSAVWDNTLGRLFDTGGMLESGGVAVNKSGKPERVLSPSQTVAFETLVTALPSMFAGAGAPDELAAAIGSETAKALSDTLASVPGAVGDSALDFFGMKGTWFTDPAVLEVSWDAAKDATEDAGGATDVALDAADSAADAADSSADAADAAADTAETVAGMSDPADEDAEDAPAPSTADAAPVADTAAPATGAGDVAAATGTGGTERVNLDRGMVQNLVMENVTTVDPLEVAREVSRMARVAMAGII